MAETLLDIRGLRIRLKNTTEPALVNGVDLSLQTGAVHALVGDSGGGKSLIAAAVMGVLAENLSCEGEIRYRGQNLLARTEKQLREIRGREIGIVMQNCAGSLDPLVTCGRHLAMVVRAHRPPGGDVREICHALLRQVRLDEPAQVMRQYPHQLSGGMKQRLQMAIGLAGRPQLLILDEPTKGLDGVLRDQTREMIDTVRRENDLAVLLITHDMELARSLSDECAVLREGRITTHGKTRVLFATADDPALAALLAAEERMNGFFADAATWR